MPELEFDLEDYVNKKEKTQKVFLVYSISEKKKKYVGYFESETEASDYCELWNDKLEDFPIHHDYDVIKNLSK